MGLSIDGMPELLRKLEQLGRQGEQIRDKALLEGAKIIQEAASQKVNLGPHKEHLKDSIVVSEVNDDGTVDIGPDRDHFYGLFVEFGRSAGTYKTKTGKQKSYPAAPPYPFLQPAFEENKEQVQQKMADVIRRELGL
jgi:HK97 gp10 family phage protein